MNKIDKHTPPGIVIAGGKTGGHLFPGIAVAQAVQAQAPDARILFVGTNAPFEVNTLAAYGFAHKTLVSRPIKGGTLLNKAYSAGLVGISLIQALYILIRHRTDFVLGVGGFSSFALVLAARLLGCRTAIQEQNAIPGMTNRMLSRMAHTIFTAFEQTRGFTHNPKTQWVGNPIRLQGPDKAEMKGGCTKGLDEIKENDFLILVTGGSQGASSINTAFTRAIAPLKDAPNLFIVHQTGTKDEAAITDFYQTHRIRAKAQAFFHDMPAIQDRADLVITRAGASTLSELAIKGKPAVLIPYPYAADDHQTANAKNLSDRGAAIHLPDTDLVSKALDDTGLSGIIRDLKEHPQKREHMAHAMKGLAMPHGARIIADHILGKPSPMNAGKGEN